MATRKKKSTHTPDDWTVPHFALSQKYWDAVPNLVGKKEKVKSRCNCGYVLCDHYMGAIATVHFAVGENEGDDPPVEEAVANAYLIAAAPKLYAACKAVLRATDMTRKVTKKQGLRERSEALAMVHLAVKKAEERL